MADATTAPALVGDLKAGMEGREYRKGNWTLHETVILIAAKKLDDEQRLKSGEKEKSKSAEFRWKWVENYCWKNGCQRSQNQCNDKWDNLIRDYKKVRDYEIRSTPNESTYWQLEKHERKERGLPSNLLLQVYDALIGIVDKRVRPKFVHEVAATQDQPSHIPQGPSDRESEDWESEGSAGVAQSPAKKRKGSKGSNGVLKYTSELSRILLSCEDKRDKRHTELLGVKERRLQLEETKCEISRQGIADTISAVNNLANALLAFAAEKKTSTSSF